VLATSCARATARAIRVQDALSHRDSLAQPILGQLRSSGILVSKTKKTTFQKHHIALSANVLFGLTLPRSLKLPLYMDFRTTFKKSNAPVHYTQTICFSNRSRGHYEKSESAIWNFISGNGLVGFRPGAHLQPPYFHVFALQGCISGDLLRGLTYLVIS